MKSGRTWTKAYAARMRRADQRTSSLAVTRRRHGLTCRPAPWGMGAPKGCDAPLPLARPSATPHEDDHHSCGKPPGQGVLLQPSANHRCWTVREHQSHVARRLANDGLRGIQMADGTFIHAGRTRVQVEGGEDLDQLRGAIGNLLQVHNVALLIGAGASVHLGSPTIRNVSADGLKALAESVGMPLQETSLELANAIVGANSVDLEPLLGSLSAATSYAEAMASQKVDVCGTWFSLASMHSLQSDLNVVLAAACDLPHRVPDERVLADPLAAHRRFFERLLGTRRENVPAMRVFTTNYDLIIEKALDEARIPYIDGFVGTYRRKFLPSMYDVELYRRSGPDGRRTRIGEALYLYKLHGSINWRAETVGGRHAIVSETVTSGTTDSGGLALIYPTPQKEGEVLGFPYADLMRAFGDALGQPETTVVVIGYGFSDAHINRILIQSMESNPTLQMLLIEPFGEVLQYLEEGGESPSAAARIAASGEPRISVLTGPVAKFVDLWSCLPQVELRRSSLSDDMRPLPDIAGAFSLDAPRAGEADVDV